MVGGGGGVVTREVGEVKVVVKAAELGISSFQGSNSHRL